jgi:hypothetical protein
MKRGLFLSTLAAALFAGVGTVTFAPSGLVTSLLILSFVLCILLSWLVVIENRAFTLEPWHLLFLGPLKATATIKVSGRLQALWITVTYLAGIFLGIAWVANA